MDEEVDVVEVVLRSLAVLLDDEQVEVVVVEGLALFDVILVAQDVAEQFVVPRFQLVEEGLDRLEGKLPSGDGLDEVRGLEQEVKEVKILLDILTKH